MMTIGFWFWVIYVIALIFYGVSVFRERNYSVPEIIFWILIALLGIGTFGGPLK
jgi:hypothetical protein